MKPLSDLSIYGDGIRVNLIEGPVGAGKTTHAYSIRRYLEVKGYKVKMTHLKINHLIAYLALLILRKVLVLEEDIHPINALLIYRRELFKRIYSIWVFLDLLSIVMKTILGIVIPQKLGFIVICEEGPIASIVEHAYISKLLNETNSIVYRALNMYLQKLTYGVRYATVIHLSCKSFKKYSLRWERRDYPPPRERYSAKAYVYVSEQDIQQKKLLEHFGMDWYLVMTDNDVRTVHTDIVNCLLKN